MTANSDPFRTAPLGRTFVLLVSTATAATAQCSTSWEFPNPGFGVVGEVEAMTRWDPDGAGPLGEVVVLGGLISQAGSQLAQNLGVYDFASQSLQGFATGPNGRVLALLPLPNGDLVVGGEFTAVPGVAGTVGIARWDGTSWSSVGGGITGVVRSLARLGNGEIVAGGTFTAVGSASTPVDNIASWDGMGWQPLGAGIRQSTSPATTRVDTMLVLPGGDLLAAGYFDAAGGGPARTLARWNGAGWQAYDAGIPPSWISASQLLLRGNGELAVLGFGFIVPPIYTRGAGAWQPLAGAPMNSQIMCESSTGALYVGELGNIFVGNATIWALQAGAWSVIATSATSGSRYRSILEIPGAAPDDLLVGGSFTTIAGAPARGLATRIGGTWSGSGTTATGPNAPILAFATAPDGSVYAGGDFTQLGGVVVNRIAQRTATGWQPLGTGMNGTVRSIAVAIDNTVYAGGNFSSAGGVAVSGFARWDGSSWAAPAPAAPTSVTRVVRRQNGNLVAGGNFAMAELTPSGWQPIPISGPIFDFVEMPDGRILATGSMQSWGQSGASTRTAIWDGASWELLPASHSTGLAVGVTPNGEPVVSAPFSSGDSIMRWDGTAWQPLGAGLDTPPEALASLPNGELVAAGDFRISGTSLTPYLAVTNGSSWLPIPGVPNSVGAIHFSPTGSLYVAGSPQQFGLGRLGTNCPARVISIPAGCAGSNAPTLVSADWPFLGGTYRAVCTGVPTGGVAVAVYGLNPTNVLLSALLPGLGTGCRLLVDPIATELALPSQGRVSTTLDVPSDPGLVGISILQQLGPFAFDAQGNLVSAKTSNALSLTIGAF